jgi:hypothetical protein
MRKLHYAVCFSLVVLANGVIGPSGVLTAAEVHGAYQQTELAILPAWFEVQEGPSVGSPVNFAGLVGGWYQLPDGEPQAAMVDTATGVLTILDETPGSYVRDISESGHIVVGDVLEDGRSVILHVDTATDEREFIDSGAGLHQSPRVNEQGQVAFYNNTNGVWVWPELHNLPVFDEGDPSQYESGLADFGLPTIRILSDDGRVGGMIHEDNDQQYPFMWNSATDEFFELEDPQFDGAAVVAFTDEGRGVVVLGEAGWLWDGTELEQAIYHQGRIYDPTSREILGGPATFNKDGVLLSVVEGPPEYMPECDCYTDRQVLVRSDPLHIDGDYDASGTVDQGDLDEVLLNWGVATLPLTWLHDLPDLPVDQSELDQLLLRWGNQDGVLAHSMSGIPEPTTIVLLLTLATVSSIPLRCKQQTSEDVRGGLLHGDRCL